MNWFVYILKCSDESLYTGITVDLDKRVKVHNAGKGSKSLLGRRPVSLVFSELYNSRSEALKREAEIKSWNRDKKIRLIMGD